MGGLVIGEGSHCQLPVVRRLQSFRAFSTRSGPMAKRLLRVVQTLKLPIYPYS